MASSDDADTEVDGELVLCLESNDHDEDEDEDDDEVEVDDVVDTEDAGYGAFDFLRNREAVKPVASSLDIDAEGGFMALEPAIN